VIKFLALAVAVALTVVSGCAGGSQVTGTPPPGAVIVTASNLVFDPSSVGATAGVEFVLYFDNRDNVLHNVKLVDATGEAIVTGDVFMGPGARTSDVPALAAGAYTLLCDVHPDMKSELVAVP
jgi:plastocyanin